MSGTLQKKDEWGSHEDRGVKYKYVHVHTEMDEEIKAGQLSSFAAR